MYGDLNHDLATPEWYSDLAALRLHVIVEKDYDCYHDAECRLRQLALAGISQELEYGPPEPVTPTTAENHRADHLGDDDFPDEVGTPGAEAMDTVDGQDSADDEDSMCTTRRGMAGGG